MIEYKVIENIRKIFIIIKAMKKTLSLTCSELPCIYDWIRNKNSASCGMPQCYRICLTFYWGIPNSHYRYFKNKNKIKLLFEIFRHKFQPEFTPHVLCPWIFRWSVLERMVPNFLLSSVILNIIDNFSLDLDFFKVLIIQLAVKPFIVQSN